MKITAWGTVCQALLRLIALSTTALAIGLLSGCATHYLDGNVKGVDSSEFQKTASPIAVQLLFDFETKGVANARATEALKGAVRDQVSKSGLFAVVDDKPVPGGALLEVKINNVPLSDDAFRKGFVTGLTFGLAGSQVADGYVCTLRYLNSDGTITKTSRHAIHTTLGISAAPGNAIKANNAREAVVTMARQILSVALNDLSRDPAFK